MTPTKERTSNCQQQDNNRIVPLKLEGECGLSTSTSRYEGKLKAFSDMQTHPFTRWWWQGRKDTKNRSSMYVEQQTRQEGHAGMAAVTGAAGLDSRGQRALRQTSGDKAGHAGHDMA